MNRIVTSLARSLPAVVFAVAMLPAAAQAQNAVVPLLRAWNGGGNGLVRVVIMPAPGGGYQMHAYGACSPTPCDWGVAQLVIYGVSVGDQYGRVGMARFVSGFSVTTVIVTLEFPLGLQVQSFTRFIDGSGRSNYSGITIMH